MEIFNGKEYTRVSEILNPFSGYAHVPDFILQKAKDRGDTVHRLIECDIEGLGMVDISDNHKGYLESYKQFTLPGKIVSTEQRFYSDGLSITGKCDCIVEKDNKFHLIDWKTSVKENRTWPVQGSAYAWLASSDGYLISTITFVKLDKKGGAPQVFEYEYDIIPFMECYSVYNRFFKTSEAFIFED